MTAVKDFIVAIELGSSKITGIAGKKSSDGSIQVLAYAHEEAAGFIRKGIIYNIDKTALGLTSIINQLEAQLQDTHIAKVYVGIGGQSLHTRRNRVVHQLEPETTINQEIVDQMLADNLQYHYTDLDILEVVPQEYRINNKPQLDPIGVIANKLEGNYLNIVARSSVKRNLQNCFMQAKIEIAGFFVSPLVLADSVLTDIEKRSGCVLVDFGSETTTVAVYKNSLLRYLIVIPLGSYNITKDICNEHIEEADAEQLKIKYGSAYTTVGENNDDDKYPVNDSRSIQSILLNKIVEARTTEIIENVKNQISQSPYRDLNELPCGIIITGGGANLRNLTDAFADKINNQNNAIDRRVKIRIANFVTFPIKATNPELLMKNGQLNTLFSLLAAGKMNCCLPEKQKFPKDLFEQETDETSLKEAEERAAREAEALQVAREAEEAARRQKEAEVTQAKTNAQAQAEIRKMSELIMLSIEKIRKAAKIVEKAQKMENHNEAKKISHEADVESLSLWKEIQTAQEVAEKAFEQLNDEAFLVEARELMTLIKKMVTEAEEMKNRTHKVAEKIRKGKSFFDVLVGGLGKMSKELLDD